MMLLHRFETFLAAALASCLLAAVPLHTQAAPQVSKIPPGNGQPQGPKDKKPRPSKDCTDFRDDCAAPEPEPTLVLEEALNTTVSGGTPSFQLPFYLVSGLSSEGDPLVLTIEDDSLAPGAQMSLQPMSPGAAGQLWMVDPLGDGSGLLKSELGNDIVLSVDPNTSQPYNVVAFPSQIPADSFSANSSLFQHWTYHPITRTIGNEAFEGRLYAAEEGADAELTDDVRAILGAQNAPGAQWSAWPSYPLEAILAQDPVPFPTSGTPGMACAYDYMMLRLGLDTASCALPQGPATGIRCEYANAAADLDNYLTVLRTLQQPKPAVANCDTGVAISQAAWNLVRDQLSRELRWAGNVRNLFDVYSDLFTEIFLDNGLTLNKLGLDALIQPTTQATYSAKDFVKGATVALIKFLGGREVTFFMNVTQAAVKAAGQSTDSTINTEYTNTLSDLYLDLATAFEEVLTTLGQQETAILQDWGKLQATGRLTVSTGPDSLAVSVDNAGLLSAARKGYTLTAMQQLLPVNYHIRRSVGQPNGGGFPIDGSSGEWQEISATVTSNTLLLPIWNLYRIEDEVGTLPQLDALADVFESGANPHDVYNFTNGWDFNHVDQAGESFGFPGGYLGGGDCNMVVFNFTNWTNRDDISLVVAPTDTGSGVVSDGVNDFPSGIAGLSVESVVPPYGTTLLAGAHGSDSLTFDVSVVDARCDTPVLSFTIHQHTCPAGTDDTWIDNLTKTSCDGITYNTPNPVVTVQNGGEKTGGAVAFSLYQDTNNLPWMPVSRNPRTITRLEVDDLVTAFLDPVTNTLSRDLWKTSDGGVTNSTDLPVSEKATIWNGSMLATPMYDLSEGVQERAVLVSSYYDGDNYSHHLDVVGPDRVTTATSFVTNNANWILDADFDGDGLTEVLRGTDSPGMTLDVIWPVDRTDIGALLQQGPALSVPDNSWGAVGDFDGNGRDEIALLSPGCDTASDFTLGIYTVDPTTFAITRKGDVCVDPPGGVPTAVYRLAAGQLAPPATDTFPTPATLPEQLVVFFGGDGVGDDNGAFATYVVEVDQQAGTWTPQRKGQTSVEVAPGWERAPQGQHARPVVDRILRDPFLLPGQPAAQRSELLAFVSLYAGDDLQGLTVAFDADLNVIQRANIDIRGDALGDSCRNPAFLWNVVAGNFDQDLNNRDANRQLAVLMSCNDDSGQPQPPGFTIITYTDPPNLQNVSVSSFTAAVGPAGTTLAIAAGDFQGRSIGVGPPLETD